MCQRKAATDIISRSDPWRARMAKQGDGVFYYNAVSSPYDGSVRFTVLLLYTVIPGRLVQSSMTSTYLEIMLPLAISRESVCTRI